MAIYKENEYKEVIKRIKQKIAELEIEMGATLSEEEISRFEKQCNVRLPEAYRLFLQEVGDGCDDMLDGFRLNSLADIEKRDLSQPFMLEKEWIWEDDGRPQNIISEERETKVYQGELELIDIGCCMSYNLIVTGNCRGEVWNFSDVGVQPCCERQDFLGWFEVWLDYQDETDYFKDYVYK
ncbi:MAG: SMI1/KNR4 family protein [Bacteroidales bacterium]|nr:SMI1/KNR4 family protein [Lachnoclostridium sp.]MCM1384913.1 SMI1/KNR4 family protein [Lachnoclostridium sp.]MCM1465623.1 SMI1/KNR4 family protein [Bacteroidales bacterium]